MTTRSQKSVVDPIEDKQPAADWVDNRLIELLPVSHTAKPASSFITLISVYTFLTPRTFQTTLCAGGGGRAARTAR